MGQTLATELDAECTRLQAELTKCDLQHSVRSHGRVCVCVCVCVCMCVCF
jgi:hypothetical protein